MVAPAFAQLTKRGWGMGEEQGAAAHSLPFLRLCPLGSSCLLMTSPGPEAVCLCLSEVFPDGSLFWFLFFSVLTERVGSNVMGFSQDLHRSKQTANGDLMSSFPPSSIPSDHLVSCQPGRARSGRGLLQL